MPNKMLIDATHPEETRVVVLRGHRVEEFDFESASRKQLRGNIYLAFSEIHPDYYQIPVADRQALIAEDERAQRAADAEADHRAGRRHRERGSRRPSDEIKSEPVEIESEAMAAGSEEMAPQADSVEALTPDAASAVEIAVEPIASEHAEDAAPPALATEAPIELAELESSSAAEPVPTRARKRPISLQPPNRARVRPSKPAATSPRSTAMAPKARRRSSSRSAVPTRWRKFPSVRRGCAGSTRSKKSSSAAK